MGNAGSACRTILLVEDDADIAELLAVLLEQNGFEVTPCSDGGTAMQIFKEGVFSLVLLDMMLPGKSGYDICREIRNSEKGSRTPIIVLSALAQKEEISRGISAGADTYITKPYDNRFLLGQINALIKKNHEQNTDYR